MPRFVDLPRPKTKVVVRMKSPLRAEIAFTSTVFQHRLGFDLPGVAFTCGDNYFELYPKETKRIEVALSAPATAAALRKRLVHRSLADTY